MSNYTVGYGCVINVSGGHHEVSHAYPSGRFFVMLYGFQASDHFTDSYGYPAGFTFNNSKSKALFYCYM